MRKYLFIISVLIVPFFNASGQHEKLLTDCISSIGPNARYIKDFTIQLGEKHSENEFRYKATLSLIKKTRYRFTLCTASNSKGKLILDLKDDSNNTVLSSYDQKSGVAFPFVDLTCSKSGTYQVYFDFTGGQSGSGVSIVSMIQ